MKRKIIKIDEDKCTGCGLCVGACHEGAIQMVDGKAKLISESYCDGLGACLPHCPAEAITIEEREAEAFDEEYARKHQEEACAKQKINTVCACPGTTARTIKRQQSEEQAKDAGEKEPQSRLMQWPCQIKLAPVNAPYFKNANLLIAADCAAYAHAGMHEKFMKNKITLIGCPKLDGVDYSEKLADIIKSNDIKSITVVRMEVPCCGGLTNVVKNAIIKSGRMPPWHAVTISTDGVILEEQ